MKKRMPIILGAVIIIIALVAMLLFVFGGNYSNEPAMDLTGNWTIVMSNTDGIPEIPENDSVVFEGDQATVYRNGEVFASSTYTLGAAKLDLPDMSRHYDFTKISDNLIKLVMTADNYMFLYRVTGDEMEQFDPSLIVGKWDVLCHGGTASAGEYVTFDNGVFSDYLDGSSDPKVSASYAWNENVMSVMDLAMDLQLVVQTENRVVMVQTGTSYVWELQKAAE